jgi:biotin carboxyl carrier protein
MEYKLRISEEVKTVEITATDGNVIQATLDQEPMDVSYTLVSDHQIHLSMNGVNVNAYVMDGPEGKTVLIHGVPYLVEDAQTLKTIRKRRGTHIPTEVTPLTPSVVIAILVKTAETVKKGQGVIVLSAMKMETTLTAPFDGIVTAVNAAEGESVSPGQILIDIEKNEGEPQAGDVK